MSTQRGPYDSPLIRARREDLRQRIIQWIEAHPGCTATELHAAIDGNAKARYAAVRDLVDSGLVTRQRGQRLVRFTLTRDYVPPAPPPPGRRTCDAAGCTLPVAPYARRFCSGTCRRRQGKAERVIENEKYFDHVAAVIRKAGNRASGDIGALPLLAAAADQASEALAVAVDGCRAEGHSDAAIGQALGITRQAVWKRFPRQPKVDAETPLHNPDAGAGNLPVLGASFRKSSR